MCLGIPGQVVRMLDGYEGQLALVDVAGENRKVNIGMLPEETFAPGDWVIIHMGFVVEKTDRAGAEAAMAGLELMGRGASDDAGWNGPGRSAAIRPSRSDDAGGAAP
jgi:hydrogenase expression/formation protein HypC